jgi:dienelactone hydrolase
MTRREALGALGALALPIHPLPRPAPSPGFAQATGPDLGNLYGTMEWLARESAPTLSFLDPRWRTLAAWKAAARPALHRHLAFDPAPLPVRGETTAREERDGFTVETVAIHASPAYTIPARVLVPRGGRGRMPAVVALHCHGGQYAWGARKLVTRPDDPPALAGYRERLYGRPYAEVLARRGFVVIAIDAFYFGERRLRPETLDPATVPAEAGDAFRSLATLAPGTAERIAAENRVASAFEAVVAKTLLASGASWPGLLAWDDRRTVDYLATRADVDPARIGCIGFSGGALRASLLAGSDPRIRAACVTAWMVEMGSLLPSHARRHTWMAYTPGLRRSLDLPDVAALVAPGALLVQQCTRDTLFPMQGMRAATGRLAAIFAKASIPERFRGTFYDEPHSFRPAMQDEAIAWKERWL